MKFIAFAATAAAFAIPDASMISQLVLADNNKAAAAAGSVLHDVVDSVKAGIDTGVEAVNDWLREGIAHASDAPLDTAGELDEVVVAPSDTDLPVFDPVLKHKASNLTIYELIAGSNLTTNFTALLNQFPAVVEMLNTTVLDDPTTTNFTLFVPVDTAFAKLPGGALNETRPEVLESIVRYHVGLGAFPYKVMFNTHTIASAYNETLLGGEPQRLRVRFEKSLGVRVNFYSRVVAPNFSAANGVIHAVDSVIVPPTYVGRELSLVPAHYSTLLLAMAKSNFTETIHGTSMTGATVFAPSNIAFTQLGAAINAFLFNTPRGLKYLNALLRYNVAPNSTIYSDAYYGDATPIVPAGAVADDDAASAPGIIEHVDFKLPTLLGNATVAVNITAVPGFSVILVNGKVRVAVQDGVAKNGVIQEVGTVIFPPAPKDETDPDPGNPLKDKPVTTIADVIARLGPYVDDDGSDDVVDAVAAAAPFSEL